MFKSLVRSTSAAITLSWSTFSALATVYDSDGSSTSIQSIHDTLAQNGDTITLPAGEYTWSGTLHLRKAIRLIGQGAGVTKIHGGSLDWSLPIQDEVRFSGIEWTPSSTIHLDTVIGVFDHFKFNFSYYLLAINDGHWNGDPDGFGDYSWADATGFGTKNFIFFEDGVFNNTASSKQSMIDTFKGGRWVVRHCILIKCQPNVHGTESTQRQRGGRAFEMYDCLMQGNNSNNFIAMIRSGVFVHHDNNYAGWSPWGIAHWQLFNFRLSSGDMPWGAADGTSQWDRNDPNLYFSGIVSAVNGLTVTIIGANWSTDQWTDFYTLRKVGYPLGYTGSLIDHNSANTATVHQGHDSNTRFAIGDLVEIRKVNECLDGVGRAMGSLIQGYPPSPFPNGNDQVTEACYTWNNPDEHGNNVYFAGGIESILEGVHFFNGLPMPGYAPYTYPHPLVADASSTPSPSATPTPTPTSPSPTPTPTPQPSPTPTATATATATAEPSPTATATATTTPEPTSTPSATATATPTPTATATPRHTPKPRPSHGPQP